MSVDVFVEREINSGVMDDQTTFEELREQVQEFVAARAWESKHEPKNLAMSIAIEAAELMEHFQFRTNAEIEEALSDSARRDAVADELADVLIYCIAFANRLDIDISTAIKHKLARNENRFPRVE